MKLISKGKPKPRTFRGTCKTCGSTFDAEPAKHAAPGKYEPKKPTTLREYAYLKAHPGAFLGNTISFVANYDPECAKCKSAFMALLAAEQEQA